MQIKRSHKGGRPKAIWNKGKEQVLEFQSSTLPSRKLVIKKDYSYGKPSYTVYTDNELKFIYGNYRNLDTESFLTKINEILSVYFPRESIECTGDNLLFAEIADSHFTKMNVALCNKKIETAKHDLSYVFQKHFMSDKVKQIFNIKLQQPLPLDKELALKCNEAIKKATETMINQARIANVGTLLSVGTLGTTVVASLMMVSGATAATGIGLPIAAGLMTLALVANSLYRLYNRNQELKNVMFLIWVMCYRFENLIRLMLVMSQKYGFDINITLMPLKGVMERLIGQIVALAPRSTFIQMKEHYKGIIPTPGNYDITNNDAFKQRDESHETDKSSVWAKFKNSAARSLLRITSPDENYRVLIRDVSILGLWFSIIFSEFMMVIGVRNARIKHLVKAANPELQENSIPYLQAQLDFMNSIEQTPEYQNLIKNAAISEKVSLPQPSSTTSIDAQINQQTLQMINELSSVGDTKDKLNKSKFEEIISSDEMNEIIFNAVNTVFDNYKKLTTPESKNAMLNEIENNLALSEVECPNDEDCIMQKMPIMLSLHLFYILFQKLSTLDKKFATKSEFYAAKRDSL
jgi:hypothetical protein